MKEYNKSIIPLARDLRKNMTPWERKLWYQFLNQYPLRFQRQKVIGEYIVDFYCAKAGLAIELDGGGHYCQEQMEKDEHRTRMLEKMGVRVVRICNLDIDKNFAGVCDFLDMEVKKSLPQSAALTAPSSEGACLRGSIPGKIFALGFFDGVHLGHQALLQECVSMARQYDYEPAAITFDRHPQSLFTSTPPGLINSNADRDALLCRFGMESIHRLEVSAEVMSTNWRIFLENLLEKGAVGFVCGDDFRFGHKGEGNAEKLAAFCGERDLPCMIVPEQTLDGIRISSTHIRSLIEAGDMEEAEKFLGHLHILSGEVVSGRRIGRTIGVPTANILIPNGVVTPKLGVYACTCQIGGKEYLSVTNIGSRPTVGGHQTRAESWILDFDGDLYGKTVTLEFHKFLRAEVKFENLTALCAQIQRDAVETRSLLR